MSPKPRANRLPADTWIYLVFFGLVCGFFYDSLFLGRVLLARDTFVDFIPRLEFAKSAYRDFVVPLWNPQTACGHPFFADPYMGVAYPGSALFYLLPVAWAYRLTLVLHLTLGGCGMIALARHWGLRPSAALIAAIGFVFGTHTIAMMEFFNAVFPLCWGPLIIYLTCRLYDRCLALPPGEESPKAFRILLSNWGLIAILAVTLALAYLSGNPQYLAFSLLLVGGYLVGRLVYDRKLRAFAYAVAMFAIAGVAALLLSAPHLLPFLELLEHTYRSTAIDPGYNQGSIHPSYLLTLFLPFLFGVPGDRDAHWAETILEYQLSAFYVGLIPLICAFFALRLIRGTGIENLRWFRFLAVLLLVCLVGSLLMAAGNHLPVYEIMLKIAPGLDKLRWPSKFMLLATYAIPLLGGLGLHLLLERKSKNEASFKLEWVVLAIVAALSLVLFSFAEFAPLFRALVGGAVEITPERLAIFRRDSVTAGIILGAAVSVLSLLLVLKGDRRTLALEFTLVAVAFLNLAAVSRRVHPVTADNPYDYKPQVWDVLRNLGADGDPHWRIYSSYTFEAFALYGVSDPDIFRLGKKVSFADSWLPSGIPRVCNSALSISRYYDFYESIRAVPPDVSAKFMDLLNVRFFIGGPPWPELAAQGLEAKITVVPRDTRLPRAFLAQSWRTVDDFASGMHTLASPEFDIRKEIILEASQDGNMPALQNKPAGPAAGTVGGIRYDWNRVEMRVSAPEATLLVVNDTWFPDWRATVNGESQDIFRANLLFRAVEVPAGESEVVFEYKPASWRNGLLVGLGGIVLLVAGFAGRRVFR